MRLLFPALLLTLALGIPGAAGAATFLGVVTHVTDGDTVWVLPQGAGEAVEIRLLHLDAPEGCQSYGAESKHALRERVLHKAVRVHTEGRDDYDRQLARIREGREDVGAWMVRHGYAWSMTFHGRPGPYAGLEAQARDARRGLWSVPGALDPRSFRKRFGRCQ